MGIVLSVVLITGYYIFQSQTAKMNITNFEQCADAGYPIQESYPARCVTPDGQAFTQPL